MKTTLEEIKNLVKKYPNDMELGEHVRSFIYQLENTEESYKAWKRKWTLLNEN